MLLTLAQIIGGLVSGSLSLVADAVHNFSDAASLLLALVAVKVGRRPADDHKTFGYKRAETVAALINLTALIMIGLFLCYEAVVRFFDPEPIAGVIVIIVAGGALLVDIFTAVLTYRASKNSLNIKAAFIHNLTDAFASIGVIISGALILLYGWVWSDAAMTLLIAGYVLWHGFAEIPKAIHLLMEGVPEGCDPAKITTAMEAVAGVKNVHHVHVWQIDEHHSALEAHVVIDDIMNMDKLKLSLKELLNKEFDVSHSTLEFETVICEESAETCCE